MNREEGRNVKELYVARLPITLKKATMLASGVICCDYDAFVPQGESALGLSTQETLICASFETMSRIINIVSAGMTMFIEVRIADYLQIAMFLPNKPFHRVWIRLLMCWGITVNACHAVQKF